MTREDRDNEIRDYVEYLDLLTAGLTTGEEPGPRRIMVLGFSQGTHTAVRWVTLGQTRPSGLVLWGGGLPYDLDPEKGPQVLRMLGVTLVAGATDRLVPASSIRGERSRMQALGIPTRLLEHPGGHTIHPDPLPALASDPVFDDPVISDLPSPGG